MSLSQRSHIGVRISQKKKGPAHDETPSCTGPLNHSRELYFPLFFFRIAFSCDFEGDALFPDRFFDEDVDPCGHAHAYGIAKLFKVFFQLIVDAYANRCLCHDSPLLSIQASQDFLNLFLHFLVFFFQGIDSFILGSIVSFDS